MRGRVHAYQRWSLAAISFAPRSSLTFVKTEWCPRRWKGWRIGHDIVIVYSTTPVNTARANVWRAGKFVFLAITMSMYSTRTAYLGRLVDEPDPQLDVSEVEIFANEIVCLHGCLCVECWASLFLERLCWTRWTLKSFQHICRRGTIFSHLLT